MSHLQLIFLGLSVPEPLLSLSPPTSFPPSGTNPLTLQQTITLDKVTLRGTSFLDKEFLTILQSQTSPDMELGWRGIHALIYPRSEAAVISAKLGLSLFQGNFFSLLDPAVSHCSLWFLGSALCVQCFASCTGRGGGD